MADPSGIVWDDAAPAADSIVWDDQQQGPPAADFGNVQAGAVQNANPSIGTLGRWASGVPTFEQQMANEGKFNSTGTDFVGNVASAIGGAREDYQYPQEYDANGQPKRRISGSEGLVRGLAADLGEFGDMGLAATPMGLAQRVASAITGQEAPSTAANEAVRLHPDTEQYTGARAELEGELGHNIISNLLPLEGAAEGVSKFFLGAERRAAEAVHGAALVGDLGPEAQGAATANEIAAQAVERHPAPTRQPGDLNITPEMRQPAAAITPEQEARDVVSNATLDPSARPAAGEAEGLPLGGAPEPQPAAAPAAGAPADAGAGVAPPEPLYHASLSPDIQSFDVARSGTQSDTGVLGRAAAYATGDERLAPFYLGPQKDQGTLYKLEHQLKNPAEFDSPQAAVEWQGERGTDSPEAAERVRQKYLDAGYDGAVVRNPQTGKVMEAAIFDPAAVRITGKRPIKAPEPQPVVENASREAIEAPNAENVRVDQGPAGSVRQEPAGGEVGSGRDLQQPREEGGNAVPESLRPAGAAPERHAEPVSPEDLTGVSHARVAEERSAKGLDELHYELKRRFPDVHAKAAAAIEKDPNAGRALVQSVIDKPRPLSAEETVTMALDRARVKNETDRAYADAADAMDRGDVNAEADARARLKMADEEMAKHDQASKASGYEGGIGLAARDILVKRDYSLAEVRQRARVASGDAVPKKVESQLAQLTDAIKEKDARIADLERSRVNAPKEPVARAVARKADAEFKDLSKQLKSVAQIICGV